MIVRKDTTALTVDHFAIRVSDLEASIQFYQDVFNLKLLSKAVDKAHHEAFAFMELNGGNLELLQILDDNNNPLPFQKPKIDKSFCPHLAIKVNSLDEFCELLRSKNIAIVKGPLEITDLVKWLYIADEDNNIIEFIEWL